MNLQNLNTFSENLQNTDLMPVLFLGHGSPMNAVEENQFVEGFKNLSKKIEKPKAILCISAHWFTDGTFLTSGEPKKQFTTFTGSRKNYLMYNIPQKVLPNW